jgi:Na+-transporting methylmalonyl-CoA/oxaloacetate decarboxylase gamma subunit
MTQNIVEALLLLAAGMAAVFTALLMLAGMIRLLVWADRTINSLRIRKYAEKVETHKVDDVLNDEIVAVISAAVTTALGRAVKIRKVRFLSGEPAAAWAVTGRLNIMASHAISRRKPRS